MKYYDVHKIYAKQNWIEISSAPYLIYEVNLVDALQKLQNIRVKKSVKDKFPLLFNQLENIRKYIV
jgi:hypothetical protein